MANNAMSNYLENAVLNYFLKGTVPTPPPSGTVYAGIFVDATGLNADQPSTEVSPTGTGYLRKAVTLGAVTSGIVSNSLDVLFDVATANWGIINYVGIFDAPSGGNLLFWGNLSSSKTINSGDQFKIASGNLTITLD